MTKKQREDLQDQTNRLSTQATIVWDLSFKRVLLIRTLRLLDAVKSFIFIELPVVRVDKRITRRTLDNLDDALAEIRIVHGEIVELVDDIRSGRR